MTSKSAKHTKNTRAGRPWSEKRPAYFALVGFSLLIFSTSCRAGDIDRKFTPGVYETMLLAVDSNSELLGYYHESQGDGVVKTCSFFLKGKSVRGEASIVTWSDRAFAGLLSTAGDGQVILKIEQGREHPGCGLVLLPEISNGITLSQTAESKWTTLKIVKGDRASLFAAPALERKTIAYFIKDDVLGVLSAHGEWANVEFPRAGKKSIRGWVRLDDLRDLIPPAAK